MDDVQQERLSAFLQKAQEKLPDIESFLLTRDSEGCDLHALDAAFRASRTLKESAGLILADSVKVIALRIEKILEKNLLTKTCPTPIEYDALSFALKQMCVLIDCLKNGNPEHPEVAKKAIQTLDLAGAFPGKPSHMLEQSSLMTEVDPFAEDSSFDRLDVDYDDSAIVGLVDSSMPDDPFSDDQQFELSGSSHAVGSMKLGFVNSDRPYIDPFAEDPDFEPTVPKLS